MLFGFRKTEPTVGETLKRARVGDSQAWADLYDRFSPTIRSYLLAQGVAGVDDFLGEIWLQVVRDLSSFKGFGDDAEKRFRNWLLRIAHNRVVDYWRLLKRSPQSVPIGFVSELQFIDKDVSHDLEEPNFIGDLFDEAGPMSALLCELTSDQRAVIFLRYVVDLSLLDIAAVMGKTVASVKMLQARAVRQLSRQINKPGESRRRIVRTEDRSEVEPEGRGVTV